MKQLRLPNLVVLVLAVSIDISVVSAHDSSVLEFILRSISVVVSRPRPGLALGVDKIVNVWNLVLSF